MLASGTTDADADLVHRHRSVYQAYEQARGADFAWVFSSGNRPINHDTLARINRAINELKIGWVHMPDPRRSTEWEIVRRADRRRHISSADRDGFLTKARIDIATL
jgi:hypothetical protein